MSTFKVYLAGPMRGIPEYNFPAFIKAAAHLREHGIEVVSPAEMDLDAGIDPNGPEGFDLAAYHEAMRRDYRALTECYAIAMLDGWWRSVGATAELRAAINMGLRRYAYCEEHQTFMLPTPLIPLSRDAIRYYICRQDAARDPLTLTPTHR